MRKLFSLTAIMLIILCLSSSLSVYAEEKTSMASSTSTESSTNQSSSSYEGSESPGEFEEEPLPKNPDKTIMNNIIPKNELERKQQGSVEVQYNQYPLIDYSLDLQLEEKSWWDITGKAADTGHYLLYIISSIGWAINVIFVRFVIMVVENAFSFSFIDNLADTIGQAVQEFAGFNGSFNSTGLWSVMLQGFIVLIGTWAIYMGVMRRAITTAWKGILSSILVMVCALGFFANASGVIKSANNWSSDMQKELLAVTASIANPGNYSGEESYVLAGNQLWSILVHKPFQFLEFGTSENVDADTKAILSKRWYSDSRGAEVKKQVEENGNVMMTQQGTAERIVFIGLTLLVSAIMGVVVLLLSGGIIFYQLLFVLLALLAPIMLLMGLVPSWTYVAKNWVVKMVGAQLMKIAIAVFLSMLFGVSALLQKAVEAGNYGYLGGVALQLILLVGIIVKRRDILGAVMVPVRGETGSTGRSVQYLRSRAYALRRQAAQAMRQGRNGWMPQAASAAASGMAGRTSGARGATSAASMAAAAIPPMPPLRLISREEVLEAQEKKKEAERKKKLTSMPAGPQRFPLVERYPAGDMEKSQASSAAGVPNKNIKSQNKRERYPASASQGKRLSNQAYIARQDSDYVPLIRKKSFTVAPIIPNSDVATRFAHADHAMAARSLTRTVHHYTPKQIARHLIHRHHVTQTETQDMHDRLVKQTKAFHLHTTKQIQKTAEHHTQHTTTESIHRRTHRTKHLHQETYHHLLQRQRLYRERLQRGGEMNASSRPSE